jgi:Serine protease inhibitor
MNRIISFLTSVLLAGMLTGCGEVDNPVGDPYTKVAYMLPMDEEIELSYNQRQLVMKNNDFSLNLFRTINELDKEKKSNFLSPISVTYLLSMLNDGAAGDTSKEIMAMLGFAGSDTKSINELCKALIDGAPEVDPAVSVDISSYIAANSHLGVQLEDLFRKDMETYYRAEASSLDFSSPDALKTINGWCSKKTDGKIDKMLDELDAQTLLVLMNAVNFKATWVRKFDEKNTQTETFTKDDGKTVQIPMMHQEALVRFASNDTYSTLLLPYGGTNAEWYMYVLLPQDNKTVKDVLEKIEGLNWTNFFWETDIYKVDIKIPRFKTTSENDLIASITKLGAPSIFDPNKADLSKMCSNSKNLYVSKMLQKATIDVNEKGTEAVAVTAAVVDPTEAPQKPKPTAEFHANHPFVYVIQERSSGAIFFIGTFRGE